MITLLYCFLVIAIAAIYYCWRSYLAAIERHRAIQRERVTWMLWVAANQHESDCYEDDQQPSNHLILV